MGLRKLHLNKSMSPRKNPKDRECPHCHRKFTAGGLKQHMRHVKCSPASTASPRKFERVRCKYCGKSFHSTNSLRVHVSTAHADKYVLSPGSMENHRAPYKKTAQPSSINHSEHNSHRQNHRSNSPPSHRRTDHSQVAKASVERSRHHSEPKHKVSGTAPLTEDELSAKIVKELARRQRLQTGPLER